MEENKDEIEYYEKELLEEMIQDKENILDRIAKITSILKKIGAAGEYTLTGSVQNPIITKHEVYSW